MKTRTRSEAHGSIWLDGGILAVLAAIAVGCWWWRLIAPATILIAPPSPWANTGNGDIYTQTLPMWHRLAEWMGEGQVPLWNPFQYAGHPLLATALYGVFSPIDVVARLLPMPWAVEAANLTSLVLGGAFMYVFARTLALGRASSAFTGATWMLSGFMLAEAGWFPPAIGSAAWLPLGFAGVELILGRRAIVGISLLALAVAMPLFSGWLQTWVYSLYGLGAYVLARLVAIALEPDGRGRVPGLAALVATGLVLGIGLAAVQLLPTLELNALGPRRPGALSLPYTLVGGITSPQKLLAEMTDSSPGYPRFAYAGVLVLVLAPAALRSSRRLWSVMLCFTVLALASLAVALTVHTPVLSLYRWLPGGALFRKPQRLLFLYAVAVSVLAGIGLDGLARRSSGTRSRVPWVLPGIATATVLLAAGAAPVRSWAYLLAGSVLTLGLARGASPRLRTALVAGLFAVSLLDLAGAARNPYLHPIRGTQSLDAAVEAFDYIRTRQGVHRTYLNTSGAFDHALTPKQGTLRGIYSITDYEPLSLSRYQDVFGLIGSSGAGEGSHMTFTGMLESPFDESGLGWLDFFGVRFVVMPALAPLRTTLERAGWQRALTSGIYLVYEQPRPFPRAFVVHGAEIVAGQQQAFDAIRRPGFDPRLETVIEGPEGLRVAPPADAARPPIRPAEIVEYHPRRVTVRTDAVASGYLVLTDTFYPGWKATVDDQPAPVLVANYLFRAVAVGPGAHRVTFVYEPASFIIGLAVSACSIAALLGLWVWSRFKTMRVGAAPRRRR